MPHAAGAREDCVYLCNIRLMYMYYQVYKIIQYASRATLPQPVAYNALLLIVTNIIYDDDMLLALQHMMTYVRAHAALLAAI